MQNPNKSHPGRAGRKARPSPKSKPIWCGQHSEEDRAFIMQWLSPDERYQVLMAAANTACSGRVVGWLCKSCFIG